MREGEGREGERERKEGAMKEGLYYSNSKGKKAPMV